MRLLAQLINRKEMFYYIFIGVFATASDWITFIISSRNLSYQTALVLGLTVGGLVHYSANKAFTFKCQSQKYSSQVPVYILMAIITYLCNLGCMTLLIKWLLIDKIWARMLTTGFMLLPNYLLHKHITFNKKIFIQPEINLPH